MAINNGASTLASGTTYQITMRLGIYADFDPDKMVPGELAVVTSGDPSTEDGKCMYVCFQAGNVKRLATYEDMLEYIQNATEDIQNAFTDDLQQAIKNAQSATSAANTATNKANTAATSANNAATAANNALESIKEAVQGTIINDTTSSANTTYSGNKIDDMARVNMFNFDGIVYVRCTGSVTGNSISLTSQSDENIGYAYKDYVLEPGWYTVSWKSHASDFGGGIQYEVFNAGISEGFHNDYRNVCNGHFSFEYKEEYSKIRMGLVCGNSVGDTAKFEDIMIVEGTEYAPALYNSRDIARLAATVDNRTAINLFDASQRISLRGCSFEKSGNGFKLTATDMSSTPNARKDLEGLKPNTYYTIVAHSSRSGSSGGGIHVGGITSDAFISINDQTSNLNPVVVFNSGEYERIRIAFSPCVTRNGNIGDTATYTDIMLVEGDFAPGEYVPYIGADTFSDAIAGIKTTNTEMATNILQNASDISGLQMDMTDIKKEIETVDDKISDYKLLWSGNYYPTDEQTCNLAEKVSEQKNGIVLWFSFYTPGESSDQTGWWPYYVHKSLLDVKSDVGHPTSGCCVPLISNTTFTVIGTKYIYIFDTYVTGHATNNQSGTKNGITYDNGKFSLRYIYGW